MRHQKRRCSIVVGLVSVTRFGYAFGLATVAFAASSTPALAADRTWFGGSGDWGVDTNWTPPAVPGSGDRAIINAGTSTLSFAATVAAFDLGGTLSGSGDLTVTGASSWTAGSLSGAAATTFNGNLSISGPAAKTLFGGRTLNLNGTTTWSGNTASNNNAIRFWNGGTLNNGGTFVDANTFDSFVEHNVGGPHAFNNTGIYNKQSATVTTIDGGVAFNNSGTVNVNAGIFRPSGGTSSGTFNIAAGAVLDFRNGANTLNAPTIAGAGTFQVSSDGVGADATVTLNGGVLAAPLHLSGSTLAGTDQVFQAAATWSGGALSGAASTTFQNGLAISGAATKTLHGGRTLELHGTTTWSGNTANNNNAIRFWNGGTLNNHGTFVDANAFDSFIEHNVGGPHAFNNIGTYNKQSNTVTTVDGGVAFNNSGSVNIAAGTFMPSGGTSSGTFNIAAGAALEFRNGASTLNGATVSGPGTLRISSDGVGGDAVVTVNGGTLSAPLVLSGSTLTGSGQTFQARASWTGGAISGAGATTFANGVDITGANTKVIFGGRTLELHGTTSWSGNTAANNNAILFWNGGTLNNHGTFVDSNTFDSFIEHNVGGPHVFNNAGTYNKQSNTTTTFDFGIALRNTGTMNVQAGTVHVASPFSNEGMIRIESPSAVFRGNHATFVNALAGTFAGHGTFATHANGDIVNEGTISPGLSIGALSIEGDLVHAASGRLDLELAGLAAHDTLRVTDDVTLGGTIVARNAGYVPVLGDSFVVLTFDERLAASTFDAVVTSGYGAAIRFEAVYNLHDVSLVVVAVPEPETYALMLAGLVLVVGAVRRRRCAPEPMQRKGVTPGVC